MVIDNIEDFRKKWEIFKVDFTKKEDEEKHGRHSLKEKRYIALGWNSLPQLHFLVPEFKKKYFDEMEEVAERFQGEHLILYIRDLKPIDDDLEETFDKYKAISLKGDKLTKADVTVRKIADGYRKRINAYKLYK